MQKMKNPAGQGQGFETGRGGDPNNRNENMAENDVFVNSGHVSTCSLKLLFMPVSGNSSDSFEGFSLPNRATQHEVETDVADLLMEAYFVRLEKWSEHTRKSRELAAELERIKIELIETLALANTEMAEAIRLQRLAHDRGGAL